MHGNVAEWVGTLYHPVNTPTLEPADMAYFIALADVSLRGGGWASLAADCRSASRDRAQVLVTSDWIGFRIVMEEGGTEDDEGSDNAPGTSDD